MQQSNTGNSGDGQSVDLATLPAAQERECADCSDFIPENMGFQVGDESLCASCAPWPES